ncbi:MAG: AI-2E family transporter [Deltaproteobacteria bacterium RIFOXYB12_FULL_58_9]|nr:MAG: AI-2E family transporter [Deltaproteobacteria bacterium RIFOXYB12_FULL_58_9]
MNNRPKPAVKPPSVSFYVLLAAALFVFIEAFTLLSPILLSLLLTLLISLAVNPVISWMRRAFTGGRKVATGLVTATLVLIMALTGWAFFVPMQASVSKLVDQLPTYWERLQKPLIRMEQQAVRSEEKLQAEVTTETAQTALAEDKPEAASSDGKPEATSSDGKPEAAPKTTEPASPKPVVAQRVTEPDSPKPEAEAASPTPAPESGSFRSSLGQTLQGVAGGFASAAFNAAQIMVVLVTVFFGVTFTLMNPRPIFGAMFSLVPERHHDQALTILQRIGKFVPSWAGATLLGMLTIGLLVFLVMWPILGFMDALVLGLIACVLEAVPYLGPLLAAVPGLLLALGKGGMAPLWVLLAYAIIQALENNVILPLIMSRGMKLHPLAVIFSMLLCVAAFGVLGVLVAAPLVAIVDILHDELYRKRLLPTTTDADLERLARKALHETVSEGK